MQIKLSLFPTPLRDEWFLRFLRALFLLGCALFAVWIHRATYGLAAVMVSKGLFDLF